MAREGGAMSEVVIHCSPQIWREPSYGDLSEAEKTLFFQSLATRARGTWPKGTPAELAERLERVWKANVTVGVN